MNIPERIKNRDESVYRELIEEYGRLVWAVCGSILKNAGTAQDIEECAADVFIELWKKPEKFNPKRGDIAVYLKVLARTKALNAYRRIKPALPLDEEIGTMSDIVAEEVIGRLRAEQVLSALGSLKEPDREIFYRRYYFEQKPREIALAMSLPDREVRNRLYQGRKKLKSIIGGDYCET
ncbi:MAG: sigma-70 family RNA polymerase sigma factor [Oscillospiraceae bacterium]|nr:sigma-70 family RNA polymerase sigma factor [Oscillospiraceae bacterium]